MKKRIAIALVLAMALSLAACVKEEPSPSTPTSTPPATEQQIEKGTKWNAVEQFHKEEDPTSVWQYYFMDPQDGSYNPMQVFVDHVSEDIHSWYPWESSWVGVGFNNSEFCDVYGPGLEQNADGPNGMISVIGFVAPAAGEYVVTGKLMNAMNQNPDLYTVLKEDGTVVVTEDFREYIKGGYTFLTPTKVTLAKGEKLYFQCKSTSDWVSTYTDLTVYYEPSDENVMVKPDSFMPEEDYPTISNRVTAAKYNSVAQFSEDSAEGLWVYAFTIDGISYTPCVKFDKPDWDGDGKANAAQWYSPNGTGIGFNYSSEGWIEANVSNSAEKDGEMTALGFKAPAGGTYSFTVLTQNIYEQNADHIVVSYNGSDVASIPFTATGNAQIVEIEMLAGETVYFHGVSNGDWVSTYMAVYVNEFSAVGQFSRDTADGDNWIYASTTDGKTYTPAASFAEPDWDGDGKPNAAQWYSQADGQGTGMGLNLDMPAWIEANVNDGSGEIMALGFKAPAAGKYELTVCSLNAWGQDGADVVISYQGKDIASVPFLDVPFGDTITVEMAEGDVVYIHGVSNSGWVSCYLQAAANKVG